MRKKNRLRALRNFALAAVLAALLWAVRDFPLPTMEMEMHRSERQHMMDESRVIWEYDGKMYNDRDIIVGLGPKHITTRAESRQGSFWPRAVEEPTLVMLPEDTRYNPAGTAHSYIDPSFVLVDAPSRTQSARLHILLDYNDYCEVYTAEGEKQGPAWFFQLEQHYFAPGEGDAAAEKLQRWELDVLNMYFVRHPGMFYHPCTVEFFDRDGALLSTLELNGGVRAG